MTTKMKETEIVKAQKAFSLEDSIKKLDPTRSKVNVIFSGTLLEYISHPEIGGDVSRGFRKHRYTNRNNEEGVMVFFFLLSGEEAFVGCAKSVNIADITRESTLKVFQSKETGELNACILGGDDEMF